MDSFRFDFAHALYNAPGWNWHMAQIQRDVDELAIVIAYLRGKLGYRIRLCTLGFKTVLVKSATTLVVIGHSKGALASFRYLSHNSDLPKFYINLSGR